MRASALIALLALFITPPATAALKEGAKAKEFSTQVAKAGKPEPFTLSTVLKKGPVVLYFFPAAFTSGCTMEAHEFAEATPEFAKFGATVIGLAADDITKLARFSVEECRNKFAVGVATKSIIKDYNVALPLIGRTGRISYVIAQNGQIVHVHDNMNYRGHVTGALEAVKRLHQPRK
ncbi:MAG: peroxiredoxin [Sphingomonadales bacterium]|jgi:peroxiredoxin Q/BCP|nr:peroxiredoxin [Sphingomonadales bacterium]